MSLSILLGDELSGFYRSKVMLFLWIGLPALTIILYGVSQNVEDIPISSFAGLLVSSIGGTIAAAMLAVGVINERERHVYDLFVIRPVKRRDIVISKFLAVFVCVVVAGFASIMLGVVIDYFNSDLPLAEVLESSLSGLVVVASMMAISCSAGVLIGIFSPSVLVGVILVIYGANQLSVVAFLPVMIASASVFFPLLPGIAISSGLMFLAVLLFNRKQL